MDIEEMDPDDEYLQDQDALDFLPTPTSITTVPKHQNQPLQWHHKVNLMGDKCQNIRIHVCDLCTNPILVYGRLIPCKHVFCLDCAQALGRECYKCRDEVLRVEKTGLGSIFRCRREECHRTYLSQRDLLAHHKHRHASKKHRSGISGSGGGSSMNRDASWMGSGRAYQTS